MRAFLPPPEQADKGKTDAAGGKQLFLLVWVLVLITARLSNLHPAVFLQLHWLLVLFLHQMFAAALSDGRMQPPAASACHRQVGRSGSQRRDPAPVQTSPHVCTSSHLSTGVCTCPDQSTCVLTCPHLSTCVWTCPHLSAPVHVCLHLISCVCTCPHVFHMCPHVSAGVPGGGRLLAAPSSVTMVTVSPSGVAGQRRPIRCSSKDFPRVFLHTRAHTHKVIIGEGSTVRSIFQGVSQKSKYGLSKGE